jgi:DNA polymerase-2
MSSGPSEVRAFLLTVEWRDTARGLELTLWASSPEHGPVCATFTGQEAVMFVPRHVESRGGRRVERPLKTKEGAPVDALYFKTQRALMDERSRIRAAGGVTLESDVKPSTRFTMERFLRGGVVFTGKGVVSGGVLRLTNPTVRAEEVTPSLRVLSLDIETDGWDGPVLSVALASNDGLERVFVARAAHANASSPRPSPPREERETRCRLISALLHGRRGRRPVAFGDADQAQRAGNTSAMGAFTLTVASASARVGPRLTMATGSPRSLARNTKR